MFFCPPLYVHANHPIPFESVSIRSNRCRLELDNPAHLTFELDKPMDRKNQAYGTLQVPEPFEISLLGGKTTKKASSLLVLPAYLRPNHGKFTHPVTRIYQCASSHASKERKLKTEEEIEKLAKAPNAIGSLLSGKGGVLRGSLCAKRCDYTARVVVVPSPAEDAGWCSLPPLLMSRLELKYGDWILINRAPTLHKGSLVAMQVKACEGRNVFAARIPLTLTKQMGMDFDGDTITIHALKSYDAIAEAKTLMTARENMGDECTGQLQVCFIQDTLTAIELLNRNPMVPASLANRLLTFALGEPAGCQEAIGGKELLEYFVMDVYVTEDKDYSPTFFKWQAHRLWRDYSAEISLKVTSVVARAMTLYLTEQMYSVTLTDVLRGGVDLGVMVAAGAKGKPSNLRHMCQDMEDQGISSSFMTGLTKDEYFKHARSAWKSLVQVSVGTADAGYTARKLVRALEDIVISYTGAAVDNVGNVFDFTPGGDGIDPSRAEYLESGKRVPLLLDHHVCTEVRTDLEEPEGLFTAMEERSLPKSLSTEQYIEEFQLDLLKPGTAARWIYAFFEPGTPFGLQAATALSEPLTQMSLSSKHGAGRRSAEKDLKELVGLLDNPSKHLTTLDHGIDAQWGELQERLTAILRPHRVPDTYINLICNRMTHTGEVRGITHSQLKDQLSPLQSATHERAKATLFDAADKGLTDDVTSISSSLICSRRPRVGTGYFDLYTNGLAEGPSNSISKVTFGRIDDSNITNIARATVRTRKGLSSHTQVGTVGKIQIEEVKAKPRLGKIRTQVLSAIKREKGISPKLRKEAHQLAIRLLSAATDQERDRLTGKVVAIYVLWFSGYRHAYENMKTRASTLQKQETRDILQTIHKRIV